MKYIPTIGLEIHAELKTRTKMFCGSLNDPAEKHPNVNICPVCMGHPGTLPVPNKEAIRQIIRIGLALGGEIAKYSRFDRKNYFYPDLPKGYQISQYKYPFVTGGSLTLPSFKKLIRVTRVHLEEDAGRLLHAEDTGSAGASYVDFNRAGMPLMEMVTEPDFNSASEVKEFAVEFQRLLRTLGASDADMEKGQLRIEANISLQSEIQNSKSQTQNKLGTKVEIKNLNSFRAVERAIEYEVRRQENILENGEGIKQETRGWDENKNATFPQRSKEEAHDYRYFPEPDIPPLYPYELFDIEELKGAIPELPHMKRKRLEEEYHPTSAVLDMALDDDAFLAFFERAVSEIKTWNLQDDNDARDLLANYIISDFQGLVKEKYLSWGELLCTPEQFAHLIKMTYEGDISSRTAKDVLRIMAEKGGDPETIIREKGLLQVSDAAELEGVVKEIISAYPDAIFDYHKGKANALQFLIGMIMKKTRGSANPAIVQEILKKLLLTK